jgi:hypothetical protein
MVLYNENFTYLLIMMVVIWLKYVTLNKKTVVLNWFILFWILPEDTTGLILLSHETSLSNLKVYK